MMRRSGCFAEAQSRDCPILETPPTEALFCCGKPAEILMIDLGKRAAVETF